VVFLMGHAALVVFSYRALLPASMKSNALPQLLVSNEISCGTMDKSLDNTD
jgi:hypothetical protein